jgi:preprotein translocase subunit SecY
MDQSKTVISTTTKGLILSLVVIMYGLILYLTDQSTNKTLANLTYLLLAAGIIWSCISFAKDKQGEVSYGEVFAHGFKVTVVVTAINCLYTIIALKFIFPEFKEITVNETRRQMEAKNASDSEIDAAVSWLTDYFVPLAIAGILFLFAISGAIAAAIGAALAKKKPQNPFDQQPV